MVLQQTLLDFTTEEATLKESRTKFFELLKKTFQVSGPDTSSSGSHACFTGDSRHVNVTSYGGFVTVDVCQFIDEGAEAPISDQVIEDFSKSAGTAISSSKSKVYAPIMRGEKIDNYQTSMYNRIHTYDFDKVLFDEDSPYQNVKILHSLQYGNVLLLDEAINLAESDLIYTQSILGCGHHNYKDKTVLILGGGDGAILHEVLKDSPKFVTMLELDMTVIEACRKHLRKCCGTTMDNLEGDNYKIIVGDCLPHLKEYQATGKKFDFVISDLTDIPIVTDKNDSQLGFLKTILNSSMTVLEDHGKFLTHVASTFNKRALDIFTNELDILSVPVEYRIYKNFVPSFMELWVFCEVWKKL